MEIITALENRRKQISKKRPNWKEYKSVRLAGIIQIGQRVEINTSDRQPSSQIYLRNGAHTFSNGLTVFPRNFIEASMKQLEIIATSFFVLFSKPC